MTITTTPFKTKRVYVKADEIKNHPNFINIIGALNALSIWGAFDQYTANIEWSWEVDEDIPDSVIEHFFRNLRK